MKKIYCFLNGCGPMGCTVEALAEDGEVVAVHFSSNESWAKHDIGLTSNWKHEYYKAKYPEGYELVWLDSKQLDTHEGFQTALKLNAQLPTES